MTLEERSYLVLACARVLYENGQATEQTVTAAEQLGGTLGLRAKIMPRWGATANSVGRRHTCFPSGGRSYRREHGARRIRDAGYSRARRRSACAQSCGRGDRSGLARATRFDMAFHARRWSG